MFALQVRQCSLQLRIYQQDAGPGVLHDVGNFLGSEAEIDRHQHSAVPAHAEEGSEEPGAVVGDDGHPLTVTDTERVETRRLGPGQVANPGVVQSLQRLSRLVRLIDDSEALSIDGHGAVEEVPCAEGYEHAGLLVGLGSCIR